MKRKLINVTTKREGEKLPIEDIIKGVQLKDFSNADQAKKYGATILFKMMVNSSLTNKKVVLGLATGGTMEAVYKELIKMLDDYEKQTGNKLDLSNLVTFNLDEYEGLSNDHDQSYRYYMNLHLFNHLTKYGLKVENTHVPNPAESIEAFSSKVDNEGGIDLQLLGIGNNGHIGFNEQAIPVTTEDIGKLYQSPMMDNIRDANEFNLTKIDKSQLEAAIKDICGLQDACREQLTSFHTLIDQRHQQLIDLKEQGNQVNATKKQANRDIRILGNRTLSSNRTMYVDLSEKEIKELQDKLNHKVERVTVLHSSKFFEPKLKKVDLTITTLMANARYFENITDIPLRALTTTSIITEAKYKLIVATGEGKKWAVNTAINNKGLEPTPLCPATYVTTKEDNTLFATDFKPEK